MKQKLLNDKMKEYGKRVLEIEKKINTINDNYEKINNNIEGIYDSIHEISNNNTTTSISTSINEQKTKDTTKSNRKYNTRNKKIKYNFKDEYDDDETDDDPDYTDGTDESHYETDESDYDTTHYNNTHTKDIEEYIESYINTKIKDSKYSNKNKQNTDLLKEQSIKIYTYLKKNQEKITKEQLYEHLDYFINTTEAQRLTTLTTFDSILNLTDTKIPRLFKILNSSLDTYYKKLALNKIQLLDKMKPGENEYFKLSSWIDTLLEIPFNSYKIPKYLDTHVTTTPSKYLTDAHQHLDKIIYGQQNTKTHIIEILAKMISNPRTIGSVFAIHGEAGTGKTTLIKDGLSEIFGLPFIFISLGGAQDRTFLAGSNYVYEGSACGKVLQSLKQAQCMNPIFYFDELDKVSTTDKGQEIINMLIHLTDYTQNNTFMDDYMDGIAIDLSRATFVFSFNDKNKVSPILLDRMEIIKFHPYTLTEKKHIATQFLLPNIIKNIFGDNKVNKENKSFCKSIITDEQIDTIVKIPTEITNKHKYSIKKCKIYNKIMKNKNRQNKYGGVRYIKKRLEKLVSKINLDRLLNKK